jgi:hypothetical protein
MAMSRLFLTIALVFLLLPTSRVCAADLGVATDHESKVFEGAVTFSQGLSGWALLIIGASIVTLVGTSYRRPHKWWARLIYLVFLPGWYFLVRSMLSGVNVQRAYLGYLFSNPPPEKLTQFKGAINDDALLQIQNMNFAVLCFGVWLLLYFAWWLCHTDSETQKGRHI